MIPLQETVDPVAINTAGWLVGLGGIALTAIWLNYLYR
jgi:hypothetical protein